MRVEVQNQNKIVRAALFTEVTNLTASLIIDTIEKYVLPASTASGGGSFEFAFYVDANENELYDSVLLIAESENDISILDRIHFGSHDSNQLWYLFCDDSLII